MYVKDALAGRDSSAIMHDNNSLRALKVTDYWRAGMLWRRAGRMSSCWMRCSIVP